MSRDEYLQILRDNLTTMSDDDKDDVIRYYLEYFADAGAGREGEVIEQLGRPEALADRLCGTNNFQGDKEWHTGAAGGTNGGYASHENYTDYTGVSKTRRHSGLKIALLICLSPLWFTLAIIIFVAVLTAVLVGLILVGTVFVVSGAFVGAGVVSVAAGIAALFKSAANGLLVSGAGLMAAGGGIYLFFLGKLMAKAVGRLFRITSHRLKRSAD